MNSKYQLYTYLYPDFITLANYNDDGRLDGPFKLWYPNGQLCKEATYKNDKLDGWFCSWCPDGQIYEKIYYDNGEIVSYNGV